MPRSKVLRRLAPDPRPVSARGGRSSAGLLRWAGEGPAREGLADTPARVAKASPELFSGYEMDMEDVLRRTFEEVTGYDDLVLMKDTLEINAVIAPVKAG